MKRILSLLLCLCMLVGLLSGCRGDSAEAYIPTGDALLMEDEEENNFVQTDETQQLSLVFDPTDSMNPYECKGYTNRVIFPLIYQSLFAINQDNEVIHQLCKSYSVSDDLKTYTFTLDSRATFSDGTKVTPDDVVTSLWQAWDSNYYGGRFTYVAGVHAIDENTVSIVLKQPCDSLPLLLDIPIVKEETLEEAFPIGSGPYILGGTEGRRHLSRRSTWWCTSHDLLITAGRIQLLEADNTTQVRDYFEFGDAGVVCTDPGSEWYVEYRCDYELWDCETGIFVYLGFNMDSAVFKNLEARQAVLKGIDRAKLADNYYRGFATVAELPASPSSGFYSKTLAQNYSYNEQDFLSQMAAAGAMGRTVRLLVNADDSLRVKVAQEIGNMLNACGMIVSVEAEDTSDYRSRLSEGSYDLYLGQTKLSANMDLSPFFMEKGALSYGGLANVNQYALCLQALENEGHYYTLHQTVMENALICPLLFRSYAVYAARGLLTQLQPARDNLFCYTIE